MSRRLQAALFLLIAIQAGGLIAQDMVAPETYRVQIIAQPGQDVSAIAKAVAAAVRRSDRRPTPSVRRLARGSQANQAAGWLG